MSDDFYPFVDSGQPAPDNTHLVSTAAPAPAGTMDAAEQATFACRIAVYDDMLSTPRVIVVGPKDVRSYLEEVTNTVYKCMKEQGGAISLMVIREIVENFIHAHFAEPIISILDGGATIRFADQGPGIADKERAFEFGVTSADRDKKKYIRGTGAGFPMVQQYLENAGGAVSIEDNLGQGTVVTVSTDPVRVGEIERAAARGAAVRGAHAEAGRHAGAQMSGAPAWQTATAQMGAMGAGAYALGAPQQMGATAGAYPPLQGMPTQGSPSGPTAWPGAAPQAWPQGTYPGYQPQGYQQPAWNPYAPAGPMGTAGAAQMGAWQQGNGYGKDAYQPWMVQATQPVQVTERGQMALTYLAGHGICGPTDLVHTYGSSAPTWSRELETLTQMGLVMKSGQKRVLTDMGRHWLAEQASTGPIGGSPGPAPTMWQQPPMDGIQPAAGTAAPPQAPAAPAAL